MADQSATPIASSATESGNAAPAVDTTGENSTISRGNANQRGRGGRNRQNKKMDGTAPAKKKKDQGRNEWSRNRVDKRGVIEEHQSNKRRKVDGGDESDPVWAKKFTEEEIQSEERKPKRKVAVLIGYAGSGYKGMQINTTEKTIEGDIFAAFVAAGAISKANANDPKKSSLVRCARTDKGVHAAGNIISLKLIVEDPDIVKKINDNLPPQIRVWGLERTNNAFSCYQSCDSRWYEYLIPTYAFLPPHPKSWLGQKLEESAKAEGKYEEYQARQADVAGFWEQAEKEYIEPILAKLEPTLREQVMAAVHAAKDDFSEGPSKLDNEIVVPADETSKKPEEPSEEATEAMNVDEPAQSAESTNAEQAEGEKAHKPREPTPLEAAVKEVKAAYIAARKAYRISVPRRERMQEALNQYVGTINFHNYTIQKRFQDPSAKRFIRSFNVNPEPIIINDTEWLSMKVHGQSFMMHQIRKMVAMATLVVRCGSSLDVMKDSFGPVSLSIPKAPGLGLLLERPVFESYNARCGKDFEREPLDFDKYKTEMDAFKHEQIYTRLFDEENADHRFHVFFNHIDNFKSDWFLWVTAGGVNAAKHPGKGKKDRGAPLDDEDEEADVNGEEG